MEQRIVLDDKSFKALSADSRVSILKSLGERRRTLSELSQKLALGNSTVKEHCDILIDAELIKQIDEGRKWKYYELTQKGKQIVTPNLLDEVKVLIILCIGVVMIGAITLFTMQMFASGGATYSASATQGIDVLTGATPLQNNALTGTVQDTSKMTDATAGASQTSTAAGENPASTNTGTTIDATSANATAERNASTAQCDTTTQCAINAMEGITPESFILSTIISIVFGIVLGWAVARKNN